MNSFEIKALSAGYGKHTVLHDIDLTVTPGKITVLIGSNASGKSTLLKCMANIKKPINGACLLDDVPLHSMPRRDVAKKIALCSQTHPDCGYLTVSELVAMGRFPYGKEKSDAAKEITDEAMELAGVTSYRDTPLRELSGGTLQRAWIAMALARRPELLLLDEPTNFLDPLRKNELADLLCSLRDKQKITIVTVTHDLEFAARTADYCAALKEGRVIGYGNREIINSKNELTQIYGLPEK